MSPLKSTLAFWQSQLGRASVRLLLYGVLILWTAITLFGFTWVVLTSLKSNEQRCPFHFKMVTL